LKNNINETKRLYSFITGLATVLYATYYLTKFSTESIYVEDSDIEFASVFLLITYLFCGYAWVKSTKRLVSPFFVLFISCFAFNAGQVFLHVFDIEINNWYVVYRDASKNVFLKTLCFQTLCVFALTWGALIAAKNIEELKKGVYEYALRRDDNRYDWIDKLFIILAFLVVYEYVTLLISRGDFAYASGEERAGSLFYLVRYPFIVTLYYQLYRHNHKKWIKLTAVLGGFVALAIVLLGARYSVMPILLGIIYVVFVIRNTRFDLTFKQKFLLIIGGLLFVSLMKGWTYLRNYPLSELNWGLVQKAYSTGLLQGLYDTLSEMGKTINTLVTTISTVDAGNATNDRTILYALFVGVVPESVAGVLKLTPEIKSLASWVTKIIGVRNGQGYSIFAEAYFNYQNFGFLFMLVFGYIYVKLENQVVKLFQSDSPSFTILGCGILYLISYACFLSRADMTLMSSYIKFVVYISIVIIIKRRGVIFNRYNSKK